MALVEDGRAANLEELRMTLGVRVALVLIAAGGIGMLASLPGEHFRPIPFGLGTAALVLGIAAFVFHRVQPLAARWLMLVGGTALLVAAMRLFADPWLPMLALPIIFTGSLLVSGSEVGAAAVTLAAAAWMNQAGQREYNLVALGCVLALSILLARLVVHTLYEALQWAWNMQQRADELLEQARQHRADMARTLKALELAYDVQSRSQQELIFARRQAEEAQRMKERFAANVSHELRTPLNIILGFSELMALSPEVYGTTVWPPALRRDAHQIYRSSSHLLAMIDDILDLSHFEVAGFTLHRESTALDGLIREAVEIAGDLFRDRPVRLDVDVEPGLPDLEVDRIRLRQVLLNLLSNARRFTERGHVRVTARQTGGEVLFTVSDTGPGIPADKLPFIFDEFYQVDASLNRKHGGTGLGLSICKQFVEIHGGRIWAESREGEGSTFGVALPIPGQGVAASYRPDAYYGVDPVQPAARPRVLLIDPDPAVCALLGRRLEHYEVVAAPYLEDATLQLEECRPQVVVYNSAPGREGLAWPELPASVPVIQCSLPSHAWLAEDLAVLASLNKPVTADRLLPELKKLDTASDILVVDDDRGFVQLMHRMLEGSGQYRVRHAYDGGRGLAAMSERRPDVVLLDLMMPEMDGFELLQAMRGQPGLADVPVILLTASSFAEDTLRRHSGRVLVQRGEGFGSGEVLHCLQAIIGALVPVGQGVGSGNDR